MIMSTGPLTGTMASTGGRYTVVTKGALTNAIACEKSQALLTAEADLQRLLPGFDAARQRAMREFGRAEVLKNLHASSAEGDQADRIRKLTNDIG